MRSCYHHIAFYVVLLLASLACSVPLSLRTAPGFTPTSLPNLVASETSVNVPMFTPTTSPTTIGTKPLSLTATSSPTHTPIPTVTQTPTITPTPTFDFPDVRVTTQAHCRYGPSIGYLHAADLYDGDTGSVRGRNYTGSWLYIKFDKLDYFCWAAASVLEVEGDVFTVYVSERKLPKSTLYGPPDNVQAVRQGDKVIVTWDRVNMTEDDDRGYMIEAYLCQSGAYIFAVVATDSTLFEFSDESGCSQPSSGLLYTVEKHGYTDPASIPWP